MSWQRRKNVVCTGASAGQAFFQSVWTTSKKVPESTLGRLRTMGRQLTYQVQKGGMKDQGGSSHREG